MIKHKLKNQWQKKEWNTLRTADADCNWTAWADQPTRKESEGSA
jgi:hypothetical protein